MKTSALLTILFLCFYLVSSSQNKQNTHKISFGIYETVNVSKLPGSFIRTLKKTDITFEKNNQIPIIGYIEKSDMSILQSDLSRENFRIETTIYTFDKEGKYCAVVALKRSPTIDNSDINSTECKGKNVQIHFNMKGAKKWADFTKNNIGKMVAFTIDDLIYTLPKIMAEIKTGEALINGLGNETNAKNISQALNSSISN
jgi:preprotein translocase subunit SecD